MKTITIYKTRLDSDFFTLSDIPDTVDLLPTDQIYFECVNDGYISDNNRIREGGYLKIKREVPMTDEEIVEEKQFWVVKQLEMKNKRRETYLKLKAEFDKTTD